VLVQTLQHYHQDSFYTTLALAVSAVGVTLCGLALLVLLFQKEREAVAPLRVLVLLLLIVWLVGTSVMTVKGPYTNTGNGYFGAWLALAMSWLLAFDVLPLSKGGQVAGFCRQGIDHIGALLFASLVVFVQTLWNLSDHWCPAVGQGHCSGEVLWILVCSGVSLLVCTLLLRARTDGNVQAKLRYVVLFLMVWWAAGFFVATFDSPYVHTGNGFFGCWVAILAAMALFDSSWHMDASVVRRVPNHLLGLFLGSAVVLVAATYQRSLHDFWTWWAAICSGVSLAISIVLLLALGSRHSSQVDSHMRGITSFLLIWWIMGTGCMTFKHPFGATSNGYFGAWIALASAVLLSQAYSDLLWGLVGRAGEHGPGLAILAMASATLLAQILFDAEHQGVHGNLTWGLVGSSLSLLICVLVANFFTGMPDGFKWVALGLAVLWGSLVGLLTFEGPYVGSGNGYFACWVGLFACMYLLFRAFPAVASRMVVVVHQQAPAVRVVHQQAPIVRVVHKQAPAAQV